MKRLFGFIKSNGKLLVVAVFMIFAIYKLIQIGEDINYLKKAVSSIEWDVNFIESKIGY